MKKYIRKSREERIREIQLAALELFLTKGFNKTTLDEIIRATTMTKGGFYNYYHSKDEILADLVRSKNFDYLKGNVDMSNCRTVSDVCNVLTEAFMRRMSDPTPQSKLHLMMAAEWAGGNSAFEEIYNTVEKEPLKYITDSIKTVFPEFNEQTAHEHLMLIYRINNTLHFMKKLYTNTDVWEVNPELLYKLYYNMFHDMIMSGLS